jgi:hypothetical protein
MENYNFFYRVKKQERRTLGLDSDQTFTEDAYFIWQWESPYKRMQATLYSVGLIILVLAGVMFPLWPSFMKQGLCLDFCVKCLTCRCMVPVASWYGIHWVLDGARCG